MSATMKFKYKDQVEVASNEVGFVGSYYESKVVNQLPGQDYVVEYLTLVEDDFSGPLKEVVTAAEVRPPPPPIPVVAFKLYDLVDAFDNDGWWVGKITKRIANKYYVYFERSSKDEFAYDFERLRLHQEWVNGKWIIPENKLNRGTRLL